MVCAAPLASGARKGTAATGSWAGYQRHRRAGEDACDECRRAASDDSLARQRANPEKTKDAQQRQRTAHKDRRRDALREWRRENPSKVQAQRRRQRTADPERTRERERASRERNAVARREAFRRWQQANPEQNAERQRRRKARLAVVPTISFTAEQLAERLAYFGNLCWMCGGAADTVDHVKPVAAGGWHCLANLRPACRSCNSAKHSRWPLERVA